VLDAVMDLLVQEVEIPPPAAMPTLERLRHALRSYRAIALRHPHAFALLATRRFNSAGAFAVYERPLQMFADMGLPPHVAAPAPSLSNPRFAHGHLLTSSAAHAPTVATPPQAAKRSGGRGRRACGDAGPLCVQRATRCMPTSSRVQLSTWPPRMRARRS
jgi:hypothetical protein